MTSYADAAAQGAEKLEHEKNVKAVESKAKEVAKDLTAGAKDLTNNAKGVANEIAKDVKKETTKISKEVKKEYDQHKGPVIDFFQRISNNIKSTAFYFYDVSRQGALRAQQELQNPVVATHAVIGIGAIAGAMAGIQERSKVFGGKTDAEITTILAAVAGIFALDFYAFGKLYPKYDKKSLK